jgi:3-oxoadipate CoA-transferase beta subunit
MTRLTRLQLVQRVARDIPPGSYVNLGIGLPTLIADMITPDREVFLHSENGILHFGPRPCDEQSDPCLINASKQPVTLYPGAAIFDSATSFAMMRGGHLDLAVLGAYEVSESGDLANWSRGDPDVPPAVGGAMELAYGARQIWVLMEHTTKGGKPRVLEDCVLPLTAKSVVTRIYSDLAVLAVTPGGLRVEEMVDGLSFEELQSVTGANLLQP